MVKIMASTYLPDGRRRQVNVCGLVTLCEDGRDELAGVRTVKEHVLLGEQVAP